MRDGEKEDVQCYPAIAGHANLKEEDNGNEADLEQRDQNEDNDIQKVIPHRCHQFFSRGIPDIWVRFDSIMIKDLLTGYKSRMACLCPSSHSGYGFQNVFILH